jgi:hypothetical protein
MARATVPEEPVNPASYFGTEAPFLRDRTNQPDPIFSPVARDYPGRFQLSFSPTVLSMNCEHDIRNPESVKELICTGLFTHEFTRDNVALNAHAEKSALIEVIHTAEALENASSE